MLSPEIQQLVNTALSIGRDADAFGKACKITPEIVKALEHSLIEKNIEAEILNNPDKPFAEIRINLMTKEFHEEFWWFYAYLEIKISKLANVFTLKKVQIQNAYDVEEADLRAAQYLTNTRNETCTAMVNEIAEAYGYILLTTELSKEIMTDQTKLKPYYRKWKTTVHAVFFEAIFEN